MRISICLALFALLPALFAPRTAQGAVRLIDTNDWKFNMAGFIELDGIEDSTRSFAEPAGNAPVARSNTAAGETGRMQMSIRDTRLGFELLAPEVDGWKTKGFLETDFLGLDPSPGTPTGAPNSEAAFFNNPTLRVRHAYISGENNGWRILGGQTWGLIGFQPLYFIPTIQLISAPGMLFSRTAQLRVNKATEVCKDTQLDASVAFFRPPQRDAGLPSLEAGLRVAFGDRKAGFATGAGTPEAAQPMSLAVSGTAREFVIPQNPNSPTGDVVHYPGSAFAVDALVPVLASTDGKDPGNTLMLGGEFTRGRGYGDDFYNWTGNLANPLASGTSKTTAEGNVNLDGGLGDFDPAGNFNLVDLTSFNAYFQYHFASSARTWVSGGYGRLYSDNVTLLTLPSGLTGGGAVPYQRDEMYFGNIIHDLTGQIRIGLEYAFQRTLYADGQLDHNNRYQISAWFIF